MKDELWIIAVAGRTDTPIDSQLTEAGSRQLVCTSRADMKSRLSGLELHIFLAYCHQLRTSSVECRSFVCEKKKNLTRWNVEGKENKRDNRKTQRTLSAV